MATPFSRRRCPYCGRRFMLGRCPIVATNKVEIAGGGNDDPLPVSRAKTYGVAGGQDGSERWPVVGRPVLKPRGKHWLRDTLRMVAQCCRLAPVGRTATRQDLPARACVACEHPLPVDIDNRRIITIAVLGTRSAGKTHYLASAMYQAARMQGLLSVGCEQFEPEDSTAMRYHDGYFEPLFVRSEQLPATDRDDTVRLHPLIYRIRFRNSAPCSLLLHDVSGEMLRDRRLRARYAEFIYRADAAIFLVDPDHLGHGRRYGQGTTQVDTFNQADLMTSWAGEARTDIPIAITLSKSDLVDPGDSETVDLFRRDPPPTGAAWSDEMRTIDTEVRELLRNCHAHDLLAVARRLGDRVSFHAVAALGGPPDSDGTVSDVRPRRCLDPLVTLLTRIPGVIGPAG